MLAFFSKMVIIYGNQYLNILILLIYSFGYEIQLILIL
jgi:hypothetical protein